MSQLEMIWPQEKLSSPPSWEMPAGYSLRTYRKGDEQQYISLMQQAGFDTWSEDNLKNVLRTALPNGLFFIIHEQNNEFAATTVATHNPSELHPFGGELGWVAGSKKHSGKGLGYIVCAAVTKRFIEAGYTEIYLKTDDFRLPAIKTYLKLGWIPNYFENGMQERWQAVLTKLNWQL